MIACTGFEKLLSRTEGLKQIDEGGGYVYLISDCVAQLLAGLKP